LQVQAELGRTVSPSRFWHRPLSWQQVVGIATVVTAVLFFITALTAFVVDGVVHPGDVLNWFDLNVYNDAGLVTRQLPSYLYVWQLGPTVKFTYTPFAAIVFAGFSFLGWPALRWLMTLGSLAAVPAAAWLTLGAMGRRGMARVAMTLAVAAICLWTEPVTKALFLGQIEPLLLLLVIWDLTLDDSRRFKGLGIGLAAGIKLIPLLFIPYLLVAGKYRQAAIAACTFAASVLIGFIVLPGPSASYWLTGYFVKPGRTGGVDALVNQSLLGMLARNAGSGTAAQPVWLPLAIGVALAGIIGGAMLLRAGQRTQSWVLVGITSTLVSPISWDHHWVWIIPVIAMLAGLMMQARGAARWIWLPLGLITAGVFGAWPRKWSGPQAYVPDRGLLGWFVQPPQSYDVLSIHGWQLLTWNLFVVAGIVIYLVMMVTAVLVWVRRPKPPPGTDDDDTADDDSAPSPIDVLLARADAVLKANDSLVSSFAPAHGNAEPAGGYLPSAG
jgi:alpha-1,2-mannosyltransferase